VDPFCRDLITEWRRFSLPNEGQTVVVAVSGGADSVSLFLALQELKQIGKLDLRIIAAHFNHQLRGDESNADEQFVRELTSSRKIEFAAGHTPILKDGNLEQNARIERYRFLARTAGNLRAAAVLTGHTMNDQAETFLMNLIRGSGIEGLSGMKPVRPFDGETGSASGDPSVHPLLLVRPLLTWAKRSDTENYCRRLGVEFRYDSMNEDTAFRRVRVRKVLLPLLKDFNPNIVERLAATAQMLGEVADGAGPTVPELPERLPLETLTAKDRPELYSLLRQWLKQRRGDLRSINLKHIEAVGRLVHSRKSGRLVEIPGGGSIVKADGALEFRKIEVEKPSNGN
jgi:tRNA(Ile)-lysidine synthase